MKPKYAIFFIPIVFAVGTIITILLGIAHELPDISSHMRLIISFAKLVIGVQRNALCIALFIAALKGQVK